MLSYCLNWRKKKTENKNPEVAKTKNGRIILLSNVQFEIVKNQNLLNSKKLVDY